MTGPDRSAAPGPPPRIPRRDVTGILLLDKPLGWSSNNALQRVKRLFNARKAGHTGSLDPLATGMLPICLGEATKVSGLLLDSDKEYRVRMALGTSTTTGDAEGPVVASGPGQLDRERLEGALATQRGAIEQTPPMYSALKHQGQRLYQLARAGVDVPRAARPVVIRSLEVEDFDPGRPVLRVLCSKGTYVRTLVEDIARAAGTVAHVLELRRLRVEPFPAGRMATLDELERGAAGNDPEALDGLLLPLDAALVAMPRLDLTEAEEARIRHGQTLDNRRPDVPQGCRLRLYGPEGRFVGLGEVAEAGRVVARRLMATPAGL